MTNVLEKAKAIYDLENYEFEQVGGHDGGRTVQKMYLRDGVVK